MAGVEGGVTDGVFTGRARVFNGERDLIDALDHHPDTFEDNDMVVIRYAGPRGAPGMPELLDPTSRITALCRQRDITIALMTDARFSGGSVGLVIGHVAPEAFLGGPIALVEDGDTIVIDVNTDRIDCPQLADPAEAERRATAWRAAARGQRRRPPGRDAGEGPGPDPHAGDGAPGPPRRRHGDAGSGLIAMPESTNVDDLLASQIDYYRAHAPRYDDWWSGTGKHDHGDRYRRSWESEKAKLSAALLARAPLGDVLEFAGGTGRWTAELVPLADSVTVVDAAPEPVAIAQGKIGSDKVTWVIDDIFEHRPVRRYDAVFFSFWLSHVPSARFEQFWALVDDCLKPAGQVIFMDNAHPSLAKDVPELAALRGVSTDMLLAGVDSRTDLESGVATRLAADGATYDLIKIWRTGEELQAQLAALGWDVEVVTTEWAFIFGHGRKRSG